MPGGVAGVRPPMAVPYADSAVNPEKAPNFTDGLDYDFCNAL